MRNFVVHTYSHVYLAGAELIAAIKASDWSTFFQHWSEGKLCGARRRRAAPRGPVWEDVRISTNKIFLFLKKKSELEVQT